MKQTDRRQLDRGKKITNIVVTGNDMYLVATNEYDSMSSNEVPHFYDKYT